MSLALVNPSVKELREQNWCPHDTHCFHVLRLFLKFFLHSLLIRAFWEALKKEFTYVCSDSQW